MQTSNEPTVMSLSQSFDGLSMDEEFMNFLLDQGSAGISPQLPSAKLDTTSTTPQDTPHLLRSHNSGDPFAFNDAATEEERPSQPPQPSLSTPAATSTQHSPISTLPPPPPTPPSDVLSSPNLDDPFAGLTDIFPNLGDIDTPSVERGEEEQLDCGSIETVATAPLVKVKEEPKESKRKSSSSKKQKTPRASKKQKTEPSQFSNFIESLRGLNSSQLEQYAETHQLTEPQQAELKEWIRKIKNRESASLSRQNRKNHQQELETQIESLDTSNSRLKEQITELQIENRILKKELDDFKALIEKSNLGQAFTLYNNSPKKAAAPAAPATSSGEDKPAVPSAPASAGGIQLSDVILKAMSGGKPNKEGMALVLYLLMALHSYGQYWNKVTAQHQLALPQPDEVTAQA